MNYFDKISVEQIMILSEILCESTLFNIEYVEKKYSKMALNFNETLSFLIQLEMISISEDHIISQPIFRSFLNSLKDVSLPREIASRFVLRHLFRKNTSIYKYIDQFLSNFNFLADHYELIPNTSHRYEYSGLRNFLIDLEFLYLDHSETKYIITDEYSLFYSELKMFHQMEPDEFLIIQRNKQEIGRVAELRIIEYERERLLQFPALAKNIMHTADRDVAAGYDIKSFETRFNEDGSAISRFIEVKAVSLLDYQFYWTRNEIEKSKYYGDKYFLYLLPISKKNKFNIKMLLIINDPYSTVYKSKGNWLQTNELISFSLSNSAI